MSKFTKADIGKKVKCVDNIATGNKLISGNIYTITGVTEDDCLQVDGNTFGWCAYRFELAEQQVKETPDNTSLIPFSMELYKQGYEVVCRDPSIKVVKVFETGCEGNPVGATIEKNGSQYVRIYQASSGTYCEGSEENVDLFLKKKEMWVNIWMNQYTRRDLVGKTTAVYTSKEKAEEDALKHPIAGWKWVGAIKIPDSV